MAIAEAAPRAARLTKPAHRTARLSKLAKPAAAGLIGAALLTLAGCGQGASSTRPARRRRR